MNDFAIRSAGDLAQAVERCGFLPLLKNRIPGFSVEEHTPPEMWFSGDADGPWEWKGPVIEAAGCAYGKFFRGKVGFISREWFADFANFRRGGCDLDVRYDEGLVRREDRALYDVLAERPSLLSREWRHLAGIRNRGAFDAAVGRLQMMGYVTAAGFEYARDRFGQPYGWGLARYATPERRFGESFIRAVYARSPGASEQRILSHLSALLADASERDILRLMEGI